MLGDGCVVEFEPFVWGYPDEGGPCAFVVLPVDIDADVDVDVDAGAAAGFCGPCFGGFCFGACG